MKRGDLSISSIKMRKIVYAAFKGFGDLLCAAPTIKQQLDNGASVTLLVFPQLAEFCSCIDFGRNESCLVLVPLPISLSPQRICAFIRAMAHIEPDLIWISPHAVRREASIKVPIGLWMLKLIFWRKAALAGAADEPLARLFDIRVPIDLSLPIDAREQFSFSLAVGSTPVENQPPAAFKAEISEQRNFGMLYDLIISPGASWTSKMWPVKRWAKLIQSLSETYRVVLIGLDHELAGLREEISGRQRVTFMTDRIRNVLAVIARSKIALTTDSGSMHFARALGLPTITLFGPTEPSRVVADSLLLKPIYKRVLSCQPCWSSTCRYERNYCMDMITPDQVEHTIRVLLDKL